MEKEALALILFPETLWGGGGVHWIRSCLYRAQSSGVSAQDARQETAHDALAHFPSRLLNRWEGEHGGRCAVPLVTHFVTLFLKI